MKVSSKKNYIKQHIDKKLFILNYWLQLLIVLMLGIVLYDSVIHGTPLYYVVFYFVGLLIGRGFNLTVKIENNTEGELTLSSNIFYTILTICIVSFRYIFAKTLFDYIQIIWVTDAIYLLFIGIYYAKWKLILSKIDNYLFDRANLLINKNKTAD